MTVKITTYKNGPYIVEGDFEFIDTDGKPREQNGKMALCRCGLSSNKPLCDGTHSKSDFDK